MAFNIDKNGNITLIQGDSGTIVVNGLDETRNYNLYFGIQDRNRKSIGNELKITTNRLNSAIFELTGDYTDLMKVPINKPFEIYYYGIKQCIEGSLEDTLLIGSNIIGTNNTITVFPKKVEGT